MDELLQFNWNNFPDATSQVFRDLATNQNFTDITLACGDGQQLNAHKIVLSSSSKFFEKILLKNVHQHPLIYLKGISMKHLKSLLTFIYSGQVNIQNEDLADFLVTAFDLEVNGLEQKEISSKQKANVGQTRDGPDLLTNIVELDSDEIKEFTGNCSVCDKTYLSSSKLEEHENIHNSIFERDNDQQDLLQTEDEEDQIDTMDCETAIGEEEVQKCEHCEKVLSSKANLRRHRKSVHEGVLHQCDHCDFKSTDKSYLKKHMSKSHFQSSITKNNYNKTINFQIPEVNTLLGINDQAKFKRDIEQQNSKQKDTILEEHQDDIIECERTIDEEEGNKCEHCEKVLSSRTNLRRHQESVHEGVLHQCEHCDFKSTDKSYLKKHTTKSHNNSISNEEDKNTTYYQLLKTNTLLESNEDAKCEECTKVLSSKANLKRHYMSVHQGIRWYCDFCDYKAADKSHRNRHMRETHEKENLMAGNESMNQIEEQILNLEHSNTITSGNTNNVTNTFQTCSICKYEAWDTLDFQFHRRLNHKEELFICDHCDKEYENENILAAHKLSHLVVGEKISCGERGKDLANENSLTEHKKIHLGIKHHCRECVHQSSSKSNLERHYKNKHTL